MVNGSKSSTPMAYCVGPFVPRMRSVGCEGAALQACRVMFLSLIMRDASGVSLVRQKAIPPLPCPLLSLSSGCKASVAVLVSWHHSCLDEGHGEQPDRAASLSG